MSPKHGAFNPPNCPKCGANRTREEHECSDEARAVVETPGHDFPTTVFGCRNVYCCGWCNYEWRKD